MSSLTTTHPVETLKNDVMAVYSQALGVLQATMADAANRPKEAFQAAKLIIQKVNLKVFFPSASNQTKPADIPASGQSDAEVMDELVALDKQLLRLLGGGDGGPKRKKKSPRIDSFTHLR